MIRTKRKCNITPGRLTTSLLVKVVYADSCQPVAWLPLLLSKIHTLSAKTQSNTLLSPSFKNAARKRQWLFFVFYTLHRRRRLCSAPNNNSHSRLLLYPLSAATVSPFLGLSPRSLLSLTPILAPFPLRPKESATSFCTSLLPRKNKLSIRLLPMFPSKAKNWKRRPKSYHGTD